MLRVLGALLVLGGGRGGALAAGPWLQGLLISLLTDPRHHFRLGYKA